MPSTKYQVPSTKYQGPGTKHQVKWNYLPACVIVKVADAGDATLRVFHHLLQQAPINRVRHKDLIQMLDIPFESNRPQLNRTHHNLTSHCRMATKHCYQRVLSEITCCLEIGFQFKTPMRQKSFTCRLCVMKRTPSLFIGVCGVFVNSRLFSHT